MGLKGIGYTIDSFLEGDFIEVALLPKYFPNSSILILQSNSLDNRSGK